MMRTLLAAALLAGASTAPWSVASAQISTGQNSTFNPAGDSRWEKTVPVIASGAWTGPRLADGQPDVSGNWSFTSPTLKTGQHSISAEAIGTLGLTSSPSAILSYTV